MNNPLSDIAPIFPDTVVEIPENKSDPGYAMLAYPLFFIPLIMVEKSESATFHANQGLILLISYIATSSIIVALAMASPMTAMIVGAAMLALHFYLTFAGIRHAFKGEQKALPLIGQFSIIN